MSGRKLLGCRTTGLQLCLVWTKIWYSASSHHIQVPYKFIIQKWTAHTSYSHKFILDDYFRRLISFFLPFISMAMAECNLLYSCIDVGSDRYNILQSMQPNHQPTHFVSKNTHQLTVISKTIKKGVNIISVCCYNCLPLLCDL